MYYKVNTQSGTLTLREKPSKDSTALASMPKGTIVVYNAFGDTTEAGWTPVQYGDILGYASSQYLTLATECEYKQVYSKGGNETTPSTIISPSPSANTEKTEANGKGWLIAGGLTLAVGAILNMVL